MKQDVTRIIRVELFIINMYFTHSKLYSVNYNLIHFQEFATNRNPNCAEWMRKHSNLGVLNPGLLCIKCE